MRQTNASKKGRPKRPASVCARCNRDRTAKLRQPKPSTVLGVFEQHTTKTQRSANFQNSSLTKPFVGAKLMLLIHQH
ncbi:hypothetical protein FHW72_001928 [Ochrobactrum sp. RC6B]|nr:hypothetical protein [Ochrobactrum sp. RC6B]